MQLQQLIERLIPREVILPHNDSVQTNRFDQIEVTSIEMDSRKVQAGSLFVCLQGYRVDGHDFIKQAIDKGAIAIVTQKRLVTSVPVIVVSDTNRSLALLADLFYQHPSQQLNVIAVTGTNGKTTVTYLIEKMLEEKGIKTGRIGTINMKIGDTIEQLPNTTPESLQLHRAFARMIKAGQTHAVIEASSHALHMGRLRGCDIKTAIFTNLSQDHLDYHETMEEYKQAKGLLFSQLGNAYVSQKMKYAILNADDAVSEEYRRITSAQVLTYGIDNPKANIKATNIQLSPRGLRFTVECFKGNATFDLNLLGKFNVYNCLAAVSACLLEGIELNDMKQSLANIEGIPGRMEPVDGGQTFTVIVDYAHTPDSLENVLQTVNEFAQGDIYCIVGCGGDRDRSKRPLMARIAAQYSNHCVITSDNPRSEDPQAIINDMVKGLNDAHLSHANYTTFIDRKEAIQWAVNQATNKDVIIIAGKGHETYQIIGEHVYDFDDRQVALQAIKKLQTITPLIKNRKANPKGGA